MLEKRIMDMGDESYFGLFSTCDTRAIAGGFGLCQNDDAFFNNGGDPEFVRIVILK